MDEEIEAELDDVLQLWPNVAREGQPIKLISSPEGQRPGGCSYPWR